MNTSNPLFSIIVFLIAYFTALIINSKYQLRDAKTRYEGIDCLRGFLAISVFIHHSDLWYQYIHLGSWKVHQSNLYNQLGETSVSLFFMITSFLFITKLTSGKEFNWKAFFISRIYRIAPMYYCSVFIMILYVMIISHWELNVSIIHFAKSLFNWGIFTITTRSNINNVQLTNIINAGVTWSLAFEWLFYFSLPLISLLILKQQPSIFYMLISAIFIICFFLIHGIQIYHLLSFLGGAIAPYLIKHNYLKINANNFLSGIIILICLFSIGQFQTADNLICKILITIIFTAVALGSTLFGIFKNPALKFLGEICYSTYLLHGLILFTVIYFGFGIETVKYFTPLQYCMLIFSITPVVVVISFLGYKFIEKPFMEKARKINSKVKREQSAERAAIVVMRQGI